MDVDFENSQQTAKKREKISKGAKNIKYSLFDYLYFEPPDKSA